MLSRCCKSNVYVIIDYYMCEKCHRTCSLMLVKDDYDDARNQTEIKEFTYQA